MRSISVHCIYMAVAMYATFALGLAIFAIWQNPAQRKTKPIESLNEVWKNKIRSSTCLKRRLEPEKSTLILSYCGGVYDEFCPRLNLNKQLYANHHGYNYINFVADFPDERSLQWIKIHMILQALEKHSEDFILWLDADVVITDLTLSIFSEIPEFDTEDIIFSKDHGGINSGGILLQNNDRSLRFFRKVWDIWSERDYLKEDSSAKFPYWEQSAIVEVAKTFHVATLPFLPMHKKYKDQPHWNGKGFGVHLASTCNQRESRTKCKNNLKFYLELINLQIQLNATCS